MYRRCLSSSWVLELLTEEGESSEGEEDFVEEEERDDEDDRLLEKEQFEIEGRFSFDDVLSQSPQTEQGEIEALNVDLNQLYEIDQSSFNRVVNSTGYDFDLLLQEFLNSSAQETSFNVINIPLEAPITPISHNQCSNNNQFFLSKDGRTEWYRQPQSIDQFNALFEAKLNQAVASLTSKTDFFNYLINDQMLEMISTYTNKKLSAQTASGKEHYDQKIEKTRVQFADDHQLATKKVEDIERCKKRFEHLYEPTNSERRRKSLFGESNLELNVKHAFFIYNK